jgi:hypothetical protein
VWWYSVDVGVEYEMCTIAILHSSRGKDVPDLIYLWIMTLFSKRFNEECPHLGNIVVGACLDCLPVERVSVK